MALGFAMPDWIKDDQTPTLFVIACQNYLGFRGLTMNNEVFTAYPSESEVFLTEGCDIYVLAVEDGVKISDCEGQIGVFNGQEMTVVHLFHNW